MKPKTMKTKIAVISVFVVVIAGRFAAGQSQRDQSFTGLITDSMCAQSHAANIEHARGNSGKTMTEKECTVGCVTRRGQKYVLVSDGKVYQISNQTHSGLATYAAETVKLIGKVTGDTITVSSIAPQKK
jgi:hypothetical protein